MARDRELAGVFGFAGVAETYRHRPPYPAEVFAVLEALMTDGSRAVLDLGAGEGALARPLAERAERVDAVEISAAMVDAGRGRPGGRAPNLRWIVGGAETCDLAGPYGLITAGASLHWMEWDRLMPRLCAVLSPGGVLAIVEHGPRAVPWQDDLVEVIRRHSRSRGYDPGFSLVEALEEGGFFVPQGQMETAPVSFRQPIAEYVEHFHSTASLAREHMAPDEATAFDSAVHAAAAPWAHGGVLEMDVVASVHWGRPTLPAD